MANPSNTGLHRLRLVLWTLVLVVGVAATIVYVFFPPQRPLGLTGARFELTSTQGGTFTEQNLAGTPSLVFFGYTFCPDVCPTTLAETTNWLETLELGPDRMRQIFVTVDPERDSLEVLGGYLGAFSPAIIGLRGDNAQTEAAKSAFGVFSKKVEDPSSTEYLVDHTALVYLVDAKGSFQGTIAYGEDRDTALAKIKRLAGS